jgi:hypothetical protein
VKYLKRNIIIPIITGSLKLIIPKYEIHDDIVLIKRREYSKYKIIDINKSMNYENITLKKTMENDEHVKLIYEKNIDRMKLENAYIANVFIEIVYNKKMGLNTHAIEKHTTKYKDKYKESLAMIEFEIDNN